MKSPSSWLHPTVSVRAPRLHTMRGRQLTQWDQGRVPWEMGDDGTCSQLIIGARFGVGDNAEMIDLACAIDFSQPLGNAGAEAVDGARTSSYWSLTPNGGTLPAPQMVHPKKTSLLSFRYASD